MASADDKVAAGLQAAPAATKVGPAVVNPVKADAGSASVGLWPAAVSASYRLSFNKFEVGKYTYQSNFDGKSYVAKSNAEISALFGAFRWKGAVEGQGGIDTAGPKPVRYLLSYKAKKQVSVTLGFAGGGVKTIELQPKKPPNPEAVPVKPEQLKNVLDPMAAIIAISHPKTGADPCARTIPIFDGKARFDLVMSLKGQTKVSEKAPSGQPSQLFVCRVKYVPIAGHKPKDFVNPWVSYDAIEITLRPIPSAGIFVPYSISIPTTIGAAEMTAEAVTITAADRQQIALRQ